MAGHSKWAQIKRQKGAEDIKRSKLFSLLAKTISIELKRADGDRQGAGVRQAIEKARAANMPNANIERALGGVENKAVEEVVYEAFGPGGVAIIIEVLTDNRNRTSQELKHLLGEHGASLVAPGGAKWALGNPVTPSPEDRTKLAELLEAIESHEDTKQVKTNAAGPRD